MEEQIPEKEARLEKLKAASANVNTFVEKAKQYTAIDELTPELLRLFIQRIERENGRRNTPAAPTRASASCTAISARWTAR